jgi:alpha-beta hydrolase superfamily lysophospholipase
VLSPALVARRGWWRALDYAYVLRRQLDGLLHRGGDERYLTRAPHAVADVLLLPGVYESWHFLRPAADLLHSRGHVVHVVPALGYNRQPVARAAALVGEHLAQHDLRDVVLVAHSKGGLIGKLAMLRYDPEGRISSLVAVNTPFAGSSYARWVPLAAVRAFVPTDATLVALAAEAEVNSRITSVYSRWDPHIPAGSRLAGATNVELATPGHFRALADPALVETLLAAVGGAHPDGGEARG